MTLSHWSFSSQPRLDFLQIFVLFSALSVLTVFTWQVSDENFPEMNILIKAIFVYSFIIALLLSITLETYWNKYAICFLLHKCRLKALKKFCR